MSKDDINNKELVEKVSDIIFKLILDGYTKGGIITKLTKEHKYSHNLSLFSYNSVINYIESCATQTTSELRAIYVEMYLKLYRDSIKSGDIKNAKVILDSIVKLNGLLSDKLEVSVVDAYNVTFG